MRNYLKGEMLHENKQNVNINFGLLRKNRRIADLRRIEEEFIKVAQTGLNRERRSRRGHLIG